MPMDPIAPAQFDLVVVGHDGCFVVRLLGEIDSHSEPRLRAELGRLIDDGAYDVTVDLSALEFMDLTGLRALLDGLHSLRCCGGDMALASVRRSTRKLLQITGLMQVFPQRGCIPAEGRVVTPPGPGGPSSKETGLSPCGLQRAGPGLRYRDDTPLQRHRSPSDISFAFGRALLDRSS